MGRNSGGGIKSNRGYSSQERKFIAYVKSEVAKLVPQMKASYENDWKYVDAYTTKNLEANVQAMKKFGSDPLGQFIKEQIKKERSGEFKKGYMIRTDPSDFYMSKSIEFTARRVASLSFLPRFEAELKKRKKQ